MELAETERGGDSKGEQAKVQAHMGGGMEEGKEGKGGVLEEGWNL